MTAADPSTGQVRENLYQLSRPFPEEFIERKENADYVAHPIVNQRLLSIVGPFDFELVREIRGDVAAVDPDPSARSRRGKAGTPELRNVVTGGVWRLTAEIDGRRVRVEEVGDVDPHNNTTDGARLKESASDALKRCAMRLGLGLHLWSKGHYFLDRQLAPEQAPVGPPAAEQEAAASQKSEPGGPGDGKAEREAAPTSSSPDRPVEGGPPDSDQPPHFGGPGAARAWLRGQPEAFRGEVEQLVGELASATLADLNDAIGTAWQKTQQAA